MNQNYNEPRNVQPRDVQVRDGSGTGVVLGILLAVVIAVGAYFFIQNRNDTTTLEPAAGVATSTTGETTAVPNAEPTDPNANPAPTLAR